jgi:hypothetical protein
LHRHIDEIDMKVLVAILLSIPRPLVAEPLETPEAPREPNADDVKGSPVPGEESGRADEGERDGVLREVGRGMLLVPKWTLRAAFAPVRGGIWAVERYQIDERARRIFFNDAETIGLYPVAHLESGYGVNAGARFVYRDIFGHREHLALHAGAGGRFRQIASARVRSGDRLGSHATVELEGQFERRPKDAFYGIGNEAVDRPSGMPVVEARFREQLARVAATVDVRVTGDLHLRPAAAIADFTFDRSDQGPPIDELYPLDTMQRFAAGSRHAYTELELRWDTRRNTTAWEPPALPSTGWLLAGFAGRITALDDGTDYYRFGTDVQRFARLGRGPRVISGRLYAEAVSGSVDDVAFTQLPRLGGKTLLRGYPLDRFRDRVATVGSVEYTWDLLQWISASAFVDAGRVSPSLRELSVSGMRVGYGVSLQVHRYHSYLLRTNLATSIDGGVFLDVAFDPVFDLDPRVERR